MKKLIAIVCTVVCMVFAGCKTMPTPAQIETASYAIGVSTALVCNMTKISDRDRAVIIDIMNDIQYYTPTSRQTLAEAWLDIAQKHVDGLVKKSEITEVEGKLIMKAFGTVVSAADYMIRVRWPKISEYTDLVAAATHGFCDGFLVTFKSTNPTNGFAAPVRAAYDEEAYNYLISIKVAK